MPLYMRSHRDHYPDNRDIQLASRDSWLVLSGHHCVGGVGPSKKLGEEERFDWSGGFGHFTGSGVVDNPEEARPLIAETFRAAIARVGLAERPDAMPAPPVREAPKVAPAPPEPRREPEPWRDFDHPVVIHQPRTVSVFSGEWLVGLLREQSRVPWAGQWSWEVSGTLTWPPDFVWRGLEKTMTEARAQLDAAWVEWVTWCGLQQKEPTRLRT